MDRLKAKNIRGEIKDLLDPLVEKYGVVLELAGGSYDDAQYNIKVSFRDAGAKSKLETTYEQMAEWHNLVPIGSEVTINGGLKAKIIGYDTKKRKYPIIVETVDGKKYKLPESYAREAI